MVNRQKQDLDLELSPGENAEDATMDSETEHHMFTKKILIGFAICFTGAFIIHFMSKKKYLFLSGK
jgi:hypothetical protein